MKTKHLYRILALWLACRLIPLTAGAQFLDYGTDPSRLKWNEATLEHYTLIYPRGLDSAAYRYALYLENAYPHLTQTIGQPVKGRFPVILHPAGMTANGMVSWSPRRMELLTTPSSDLQAERWDKHLVLHESRHVVQTGRLMTGLFRPLYYLIGEQAAGISSLFAPRWFFEGDAVGIETALSGAGRGRLPEFQMTYKAQILSSVPYSFDKWYLGSYKDYTGTFYALGYNLTSFARYRYGADVWKKTTGRYVRRFPVFPPFSNAFKHHTGISTNRLFRETFDFLRDEWAAADTAYRIPQYLSPETKRYTSYLYPQAWNDSAVIAVKTSLTDLPALVAIRNGRERRLAYLGNLSGRITLRGGRVYWLERLSGIRWTHESHTVVRYYDPGGRRVETLTPRRRYVALAAGDSILAASMTTEDGTNRIVRIDAATGNECPDSYPTPGNAFVKELAAGGPDTLYAVAVGDEGIRILSLDLRTGQWKEWLPPTSANITSPQYGDGALYFESGLNGTNNLYRLDTSGGIRRLTSARFGAFHPALSTDRDALLMADYQAKGYRLAALPLDSLTDEPADFSRPVRFTLAETLARQEGFRLNDSSLQSVDFRPRPYRKAAHLFNVHSWAPIYYNVNELRSGAAPDFTSIAKPGVTLLSQNALNTAVMQTSWYYSRGYHHGLVSFLYQGWLPVINIDIDYGDKAFDARWRTSDTDGKQHLLAYPANRTRLEARLQVYLPLNLSSGPYVKGIQPSVTYYFTNNRYQRYGDGPQPMDNFQYLFSELRFYRYRKMATRDILPRSGYQLRLQSIHMPFNAANYSSLYAIRLTNYLPGLGRNHSLMIRTAYQFRPEEDKPLYIPRQLIEAPRGHAYLYRTLQQIALQVDYAFPLAYPDLSVGSLAYLRRLRTNLFYDLSINRPASLTDPLFQGACGVDLIADWNALQLSLPLTTGIRLIQSLDDPKTQVEALFSISF
jgi:hypothetical protein